jgi:hypothetical protein
MVDPDGTGSGTAREVVLGVTVLSKAGRTEVPDEVLDLLKMDARSRRREKLLWTGEGGEAIVSRGTLQSSFRKTILSRDGTAAVPKHVRKALGLGLSPDREESLMWIRKGVEVIVRKGPRRSRPTD